MNTTQAVSIAISTAAQTAKDNMEFEYSQWKDLQEKGSDFNAAIAHLNQAAFCTKDTKSGAAIEALIALVNFERDENEAKASEHIAKARRYEEEYKMYEERAKNLPK